jgi:hypothetical protein
MVEAILQIVLEIVCGLTGHAVLWAVTLGRWTATSGRDQIASVVGAVFWVAIAGGVWVAFFR